ncbi:MAG: FAD-dependent oxidoreductase [Acidimicrobiales bacterium]
MSQGRKTARAARRAGGWRPDLLGSYYDVAVVGGGAMAAAVAWALTRRLGTPEPNGPRITVLAPRLLGQDWHPDNVARLHDLRIDAAVGRLAAGVGHRYRAWADELDLEPARVDGGHLALATTLEGRQALRLAAAGVGSCRVVGPSERGEILEGHSHIECLEAWYEPLAATMQLPDLVFRLAEAAVANGVSAVDRAAVLQLTAARDGFELRTTAGSSFARMIVDTTSDLALARACGLGQVRGGVVGYQLTTSALAPMLPVCVSVGDVVVTQRPSGELDLDVPSSGPGAAGLQGAAAGVAAVVEALPKLASAPIVSCRPQHGAISPDGAPVLGQVRDGFWAVGATGIHHLDLLPVMAEAVAEQIAAVLWGAPAASVTNFSGPSFSGPASFARELSMCAPTRFRPGFSALDPAHGGWWCDHCGERPAGEYRLLAGRVIHTGGCGRPVVEATPGPQSAARSAGSLRVPELVGARAGLR